MALFSFRHSVKTFSPKRGRSEREAKEGQTAAHLRYITRATAARIVLRVRVNGTDACVARNAEMAALRRRGRVAERFIVALPVEATPEQRVVLAREFAEKLTSGTAGFILAIHDQAGNDRANPHMHLVAFDSFERTGGRGRPRSILGMARKGAINRTTALWAETHNKLMSKWGYGNASFISNQSYAERGDIRIPSIHEGPASRKMAQLGKPVQSKAEWARIDGGHCRHKANELIREINELREKDHYANGSHRLGSDAKSSDYKQQEGGNAGRTNAWRSSGSPTQPEETSRSDFRPVGFHARTAQPPFVSEQAKPRDTPQPPPWKNPKKSKSMGHNRPLFINRRKHRIARLWHELKLLRDTLRSRMAKKSVKTETRNLDNCRSRHRVCSKEPRPREVAR